MWNQFETTGYDGMIAETIGLKGYNGDQINAYFARPLGAGPYGGVVLVNHMPGWDEFYREFTRRFAQQGYAAICPNIYYRFGAGTPDDVVARGRAEGGLVDSNVIGDCEAAANYLRALPYSNGKVGIIGTCSGGRHAVLTASSVPGFNAVVDCWGGGVVQAETTPQRPVAPIDLTKNLPCPILGLFGNDDQNPSPEQVNQHEEELKKQGKTYDFHRYDGAGHGFFYYDRPNYRQQQAMDGWGKLLEFFGKQLA
jgi:carboxymethylenebutenolidase